MALESSGFKGYLHYTPNDEKKKNANAMSRGLIPHSVQALKLILEKFF